MKLFLDISEVVNLQKDKGETGISVIKYMPHSEATREVIDFCKEIEP
jgi:hypothetical protein